MNEKIVQAARRSEEKSGEIRVFKNKGTSEIRFDDGGEYVTVSEENAEEIFGKLYNTCATLRLDLGSVLAEYDRFRSNYEVGLRILENFYQHNARVLPRKTSGELQQAIVHMKGLL